MFLGKKSINLTWEGTRGLAVVNLKMKIRIGEKDPEGEWEGMEIKGKTGSKRVPVGSNLAPEISKLRKENAWPGVFLI